MQLPILNPTTRRHLSIFLSRNIINSSAVSDFAGSPSLGSYSVIPNPIDLLLKLIGNNGKPPKQDQITKQDQPTKPGQAAQDKNITPLTPTTPKATPNTYNATENNTQIVVSGNSVTISPLSSMNTSIIIGGIDNRINIILPSVEQRIPRQSPTSR